MTLLEAAKADAKLADEAAAEAVAEDIGVEMEVHIPANDNALDIPMS